VCKQALSLALKNLREFAVATTAHNEAVTAAEAAATAEVSAAAVAEAAGTKNVDSEDDVIHMSVSYQDEGGQQINHVSETSGEDE